MQGGHRAGDGDERSSCLGEEGQGQEDGANSDSDPAGRHASNLNQGNGAGVSGVGQGAGETREQIALSVGVEDALETRSDQERARRVSIWFVTDVLVY